MDIRLLTRCVVKKDGKFLQCVSIFRGEILWSDSPWDAWQTRQKDDAYKVAWKVGGSVHLFNPGVGKTVEMRCRK